MEVTKHNLEQCSKIRLGIGWYFFIFNMSADYIGGRQIMGSRPQIAKWRLAGLLIYTVKIVCVLIVT